MTDTGAGDSAPAPTALRLVETMLAERRAVERALHDGVQQDLIALSLRVQLARRSAGDDPAAIPGLLDGISGDVHEALARIRELADRVYPSLLEPLGLEEALRAAGIEVEAPDAGRLGLPVEAAAFFLCREAGASHVRLRRDGDVLAVELDGHLEQVSAARDAVEALGGTVVAERGGQVSAVIPEPGRSAR